ncbi:MAG: hypothetical protein ABWZ26_03855 [Candidatus Nanopelagicales bacterium]
MSHEEVGRLVRRAADHAAAYLDSVDDRPVFARATFTQMVDAFGGAVPEEPTDAESVLERLARTAEPGLTAVGSGRFFGFVMGGSVPAAQAADVLVGAAGNVNTGAFDPIGAAVDRPTALVAGCMSMGRSGCGPRLPRSCAILSRASNVRTHGRPMRTSG